MAKGKKSFESATGIEGGVTTPKQTGDHTQVLNPVSHDNEYSESATSQPNPTQHGFPANTHGKKSK